MALSNVTTPYDTFTDTKGKIISFGRVYIGEAGQDPETNPIPCFWNSAGTIVAVQPLQIVNGYIVNSGTPAQVFTDSDYSIRVYDTPSNSMVYYYPNILAKSLSGAAGGSLTGSYPNPTIRPAAITNAMYADNSITANKLVAGPNNSVKGTYNTVSADVTAYQLNDLLGRVGELVYFSHANFDTNLYAVCNGQLLGRTNDARLLTKISSLIGTQGALGWGAGDGTTTFATPDYRDYFFRGYRSGVLGVFQTDTIQNVTGTFGYVAPATANGTDWFATGPFAADGAAGASISGAAAAVKGVTFDLSRTARTSTETRPKNATAFICVVR